MIAQVSKSCYVTIVILKTGELKAKRWPFYSFQGAGRLSFYLHFVILTITKAYHIIYLTREPMTR